MSRATSHPRHRHEPIRLPSSHHCSPPCSPRGCPAAIHKPAVLPSPFRLLDLPPEVVNQIVSLVVVASDPIVIHDPRFNRHATPPPRARSKPRLDRKVLPTPPSSRESSPLSKDQERLRSPKRGKSIDSTGKRTSKSSLDNGIGHTRLAILMSCRLLYRDHWSVYYALNSFEFNALDTFHHFVIALPPRCRNQVREIKLHLPRKHYHDKAWELMTGMKRLAKVELWLRAAATMMQADVGEWEACEQGTKKCAALLSMIIRREGEQEELEKRESVTGQAAVTTTQAEVAGDGVTGQEEQDEEAESTHLTDNDVEETDEETNGLAMVLRKDREVEGKINGWLRKREDCKGHHRKKLETKPKCGTQEFPEDESDVESG